MPIQHPLIDLSYINDISGGDEGYIKEIIGIFIDTMGTGLPALRDYVMQATSYDDIQRQAHFLKSSAGIIKIQGVYDNLVKIDLLSKQHTGMDEIRDALTIIINNYNTVLPVLAAGRG